MTGDVEHGGFVLASLDAVDDFVGRHTAGTLSDDDRRVHGSHPLVVLVEGSLEAVSTPALRTTIVGFSRTSETRLVHERRRLEERDERPKLQMLLFSFESVCEIVRDAGYGAHDPDASRQFFAELFPDWLRRLGDWAGEAGHLELRDRAVAAEALYATVAEEVVT